MQKMYGARTELYVQRKKNGGKHSTRAGKCSIAPGSAIFLRTAWARGSALFCAHNTYSALVNTLSHLTYRAQRRLF